MISKFIFMVKKDMTMFFRDIRNFLLLFITPLFITILIGSVFLSSQPSNVPIIVCAENEQNDLYINVISMINSSDIFKIQTMQGNCEERIGDSIQVSSSIAGIIVPDVNLSEGYTANMRIIYDNTEPIGFFIRSYFDLVSHDISKRVLNNAIDALLTDVDALSEYMDSMEVEIQEQIDNLVILESYVAASTNDIDSISSQISEIQNGMDDLRDGLDEMDSIRTEMDSISSEITNLESIISAINSSINPAGYPLIAQLEASIDSIQSRIDGLNAYTLNTQSKLNGYYNAISGSDIDSMSSTISNMKDTLNTMSSEIGKTRSELQSSLDQIISSKDYALYMIESLPYNVEPIKTSIEGYFGDKSYIHFIFPSIIIMILLWFGTFLSSVSFIRQKYNGVLKRISISPTSSLFLIIERMFVYSIITILVVPILIIAGVFLLGVEMSLVTALLLILISLFSSFVFVSMGMIIAALSKTESTAIMISMMIVFPFIFLAGVFFPTESFPFLLKQFVGYLPIVFPVELAQSMVFYNISTLYVLSNIAFTLAYIIVFSLIAWLILRKTMRS